MREEKEVTMKVITDSQAESGTQKKTPETEKYKPHLSF